MAKSTTFSNQSEIFEALKSGSDRGIDYIYDQIYGPFCHWVYTINKGSEEDARDVFQDGLVSFMLDLRAGKYELRSEAKITTVVFTYCKHLYLNLINSARFKWSDELSEHLVVVDTLDTPDKIMERNETVESVRAALNQLTGDCRGVVELFYIDDLSLKAIAELMNWKESTAKQKRYECTEKLKKIFISISKKL